MKTTFVLKDLSEAFYKGHGDSIKGLDKMTDREKFDYLNKKAFERVLNITMKIGPSNSFRDRVDLNAMLKGPCIVSYKLEARRGYKLATFEVTKG